MRDLRANCTIAIAFIMGSFSLWAQTGVGSLAGVVVDSGGAVVPDVAITIRHDATGREFKTVSSDAGVYAFPTLDVGSYTIGAEMKGFKKVQRSGIVIQTASRVSLELRLEVGDVTQSVDVTADSPLLAAISAPTSRRSS
jgi:Carboxypeptidase regulatory-like domain